MSRDSRNQQRQQEGREKGNSGEGRRTAGVWRKKHREKGETDESWRLKYCFLRDEETKAEESDLHAHATAV